MNDDAVAKFAQHHRGPVIGRDHPDYEEARKLYNGMIDKRPFDHRALRRRGRRDRSGEFRSRQQASDCRARRRP